MQQLKNYLLQYGCEASSKYAEYSFDTSNCTYKLLRDKLVLLGTILEELEEEQVLLVSMKINLNYATVAVQLKSGKILMVASAKEGILTQNTAKKSLFAIKQAIESKKEIILHKRSPIVNFIFLFAGITIFSLLASCFMAYNSINRYNKAANTFNSLAEHYNSAVSVTCVDNIDGIPSQIPSISIVKNSLGESLSIIFGKNSITKINQDAKTIYLLTQQVEDALQIITQITAPSGEWIETRLKSVPGITGTQAVTEDNNPDGLLGREGGYLSCIYFSYNKVDSSKITGNNVLEKGTDAGGAVEVYATSAEAEARCEYLSGFDGTILYSGSYAIVGTTVIRTSYLLSNDEQFELTNKITIEITKK